MWRSASAIAVIAWMTSGAASAQDYLAPDPQKIDAMTRSCVYNSAFYSQGSVICIGGGRGLQCTSGSWVATQDPAACKDQAPILPPVR
jgi:hypothetical protein